MRIPAICVSLVAVLGCAGLSAGFLGAQEPVTSATARQDLVTKSFKLRYAGDLLEKDSEILQAMRSVLTPGVGILEHNFAGKKNIVVVKDVKRAVDEIAQIIRQVDIKPQQVFFDVKFVVTANRVLTKPSATNRKPYKAGFEIFDSTQTAAAMRLIRKDGESRIMQAPKIVALDHRQARLFIGNAKRTGKAANAAKDVNYRNWKGDPNSLEVWVTPHVVPGTQKVVVDFAVPTVAKDGKISDLVRQVLLRSNQTVVVPYRQRSGRRVLMFMTPNIIRTPDKVR